MHAVHTFYAVYWMAIQCWGLPRTEKIEDDALFLTPAEFRTLLGFVPERYKVFTQFLVMTGNGFGEATAVTVGDVDLLVRLALVRITKAWKRDGKNGYYVGATKTGAGKRTVSVPGQPVELLAPVMAGRRGSELVFTTGEGGRKAHGVYWRTCWTPAVKAATQAGLNKAPRIHDLRHTHGPGYSRTGCHCLPFRAGSGTPRHIPRSRSAVTSCRSPFRRRRPLTALQGDAVARSRSGN